jgi:hypothetical protein
MNIITVITTAAITLGSVTLAWSQATTPGYFSSPRHYTMVNLESAQQNYLLALNTVNRGVVESAIAQMTTIGLIVPDRVTLQMKQKIRELASSGATASIRYKAYLTLMVVENPSLFVNERALTFADSEHLYSAIADRLQGHLVAEN